MFFIKALKQLSILQTQDLLQAVSLTMSILLITELETTSTEYQDYSAHIKFTDFI